MSDFWRLRTVPCSFLSSGSNIGPGIQQVLSKCFPAALTFSGRVRPSLRMDREGKTNPGGPPRLPVVPIHTGGQEVPRGLPETCFPYFLHVGCPRETQAPHRAQRRLAEERYPPGTPLPDHVSSSILEPAEQFFAQSE